MDLVDQRFSNSEKRLACTLLLLARDGKPDGPRRLLPNISQEVLADMVGTTRSRVNAIPWAPLSIPRLGEVSLDGTVALFVIAVTAVVTALLIVAPFGTLASTRAADALRGASRGAIGDSRRRRADVPRSLVAGTSGGEPGVEDGD